MGFKVLLSRPAVKGMDILPAAAYRKIRAALAQLADQPRPAGCVKLSDDLYRIRIGDYRAVYSILEDSGSVLVLRVTRRSEKTYRDLP